MVRVKPTDREPANPRLTLVDLMKDFSLSRLALKVSAEPGRYRPMSRSQVTPSTNATADGELDCHHQAPAVKREAEEDLGR
jgi:hypothetical protein